MLSKPLASTADHTRMLTESMAVGWHSVVIHNPSSFFALCVELFNGGENLVHVSKVELTVPH